MSEGFSGEPLTRWKNDRDMTLEEAFFYIDPDGRQWDVPRGSSINGATIPRALWTSIGSPYAGKYRRASVVHDYFVGELDNPDVMPEQRKKADRMFYHACRCDGCNREFASLLYIGVRFGTWAAKWSDLFKISNLGEAFKDVRNIPEFTFTIDKFWQMADSAKTAIENEDLDLIDKIIEKHLSQ